MSPLVCECGGTGRPMVPKVCLEECLLRGGGDIPTGQHELRHRPTEVDLSARWLASPCAV